MKTHQMILAHFFMLISALTSYSKDRYPQFIYTDEADTKVFIQMVNQIRAQYGLHPYKYKKDSEEATQTRLRTVYQKIEGKTYEQVRDSAYEWMHDNVFYDLHSFNVSLDLDGKDYSMIGPGEIVAGYLYVDKIMVRDSLFKEVLTGWLNSPPHRLKLLSNGDNTFSVSFSSFGVKKGVFACMVIYTEFKKKGKKTK